MTKTLTRLFDVHTDALSVVEDLERAGIAHDKISLVSNNADNWHEGRKHPGAGGPLADRDGDGENEVADGAGAGATTGGLIGGGAGLLAGLGMLAIPGLGPVVAAGWLVSTAVAAAAGAVAGGVTGGLFGALKEAGHSDEDANIYAEGVRRGGTLVSVKADDEDAPMIENILDGRRNVDLPARADVFRQAGWTTFDEGAAPYTPEQIRQERTLYAEEGRSFVTLEPREEGGRETAKPRPATSLGATAPRGG